MAIANGSLASEAQAECWKCGMLSVPGFQANSHLSCATLIHMTRNITLSIDEEVVKAVRIYAAKRDTSINALVREYLKKLASQEEESQEQRREMARKELIELSKRSTAEMGSYKWNREELYDL